ncbi:MAG: SDR family oxidoreductase [Roseobacter sp.]
MTEDTKTPNENGIDRRGFMTASAAGMAGMAAGAVAGGAAQAQTIIPDPENIWTNSNTGKRVVIINDALLQVGPPLAVHLAKAGHDLVLAQPAEGLVAECEAAGAKVVVVEGVEQEGPNDESNPEHAKMMVKAAMDNFGGFDSAYFRTAKHGGTDILGATKESMQASFDSNYVAVAYALQAVLPPLMEAGRGQVAILTSASAVAPYYDFVEYVTMRAAANMLIQAAAMTAAPKGVCVNAIGTNFLNYPDAVKSYGGEDAMAAVAERIPAGRFGEPEEAAHVFGALLDGKNMFTTAQTLMIDGGYHNKMDSLSPEA